MYESDGWTGRQTVRHRDRQRDALQYVMALPTVRAP